MCVCGMDVGPFMRGPKLNVGSICWLWAVSSLKGLFGVQELESDLVGLSWITDI